MRIRKFTVLLSVLVLFNCASKYTLTTDNPYSQASVIVNLKDNSKKEGIVIKRDGDNLVYIDSKSHKRETIPYANIQRITKADVEYDFEANPIPDYIINDAKSSKNTLLFGAGGFILGSAVGLGVGIGLVGAGVDVKGLPLISAGILGAVGAYYFGANGNDRDFEDAVFEVRKQRYQVSKNKREKEINEAKRKLEIQEQKKKELLKQIEKKKKKDGF